MCETITNPTQVVLKDTLDKKATIHQVTIMLVTSKMSFFQVIDIMLTAGTDDPSLAGARVIIKVLGH